LKFFNLQSTELDLPMTSDQSIRPRAGFWRRLLALMIDIIIISLPFQISAAALFAATSGWIQQSAGITVTSCEQVERLPDGLAPLPPPGSNFARECNVYFFGAQTAKILQVGRVTKEGTTTQTVWRGYMLDLDGHPINGLSLDWIVLAVFVVYLIAMKAVTGATLGDRRMGIRLVDAAMPDCGGVAWHQITIRYLAMLVGFVPGLAVMLIFFVAHGDANPEAVAANDLFAWIGTIGILYLGWIAFLCVPVIRKRDPLYDRMAGTAVVRVLRHRHESGPAAG
jgi:uncharacterized RDD family membrane protein YckC